ncbi:sigma-54 interaction domain-containing protein [Cytobacillus sp. FJAT-54145]|uniref:HTH-type transcriptional regulatory protein TyrR n=1 Tax=Cytobacillus spartinae TaxID=3299023 RepID=A0ABW6K9F5_9BACI
MIDEKVRLAPFNQMITDEKGYVRDFLFKENFSLMNDCLSKNIIDLFEHWEVQGDGTVLATKEDNKYMLLSSDFEENGKKLRMYMIFDGTLLFELKDRVKELDKYNRELDAIIESSYDGIYITDSEGNTLKTNSAIERITGIPKHYYVGKNIHDLLKRGILQESVSLKVMEQKKTVTLVQKNFNQKETLLTGNPIFNDNGEIEKIVTNIRDLSELNQLNAELKKVQLLNEKYKEELERLKATSLHDPEIILKSQKMVEIYDMIVRIANFDTTILVLGETGVGKDVLVRHLYASSTRYNQGQFIKVNCGAIPKDLLESELFGYEGGAFSGANRTGKAGMFELADKGILFLDEIGELPLSLQVKLLRVIQEKEIIRVGGTKVKKVDVQLIAATNRNLKEMVEKGDFREDLYYRLNVLPVSVPPLRERKDDVIALAHHFLDKYNKKYHVAKVIDRELQDFFYDYEWPGNVRELSNLVERLILTAPTEVLSVTDLPEDYKKLKKIEVASKQEELSLKDAVETAEKTVLIKALQQYKTTYEIARSLKTSQATIVRKLQKYNLSTE